MLLLSCIEPMTGRSPKQTLLNLDALAALQTNPPFANAADADAASVCRWGAFYTALYQVSSKRSFVRCDLTQFQNLFRSDIARTRKLRDCPGIEPWRYCSIGNLSHVWCPLCGDAA